MPPPLVEPPGEPLVDPPVVLPEEEPEEVVEEPEEPPDGRMPLVLALPDVDVEESATPPEVEEPPDPVDPPEEADPAATHWPATQTSYDAQPPHSLEAPPGGATVRPPAPPEDEPLHVPPGPEEPAEQAAKERTTSAARARIFQGAITHPPYRQRARGEELPQLSTAARSIAQ